MTPELALQDAIKAILSAPGGPVASLASVFDEVPTDRASNVLKPGPWVYLGPITRRRIEVGCGDAWTITTRLYAAASKTERRQSWTLANAVMDALEGQEPTLADPYRLVEVIRCQQAGDVIEPATPKTVFVDLTTVITRNSEEA